MSYLTKEILSVRLHTNARIEDKLAFFKGLANFNNIKEISVSNFVMKKWFQFSGEKY